jgi:hypothetical protein
LYRLLANQVAICNTLSGGVAESLPYPVEDGAKEIDACRVHPLFYFISL